MRKSRLKIRLFMTGNELSDSIVSVTLLLGLVVWENILGVINKKCKFYILINLNDQGTGLAAYSITWPTKVTWFNY